MMNTTKQIIGLVLFIVTAILLSHSHTPEISLALGPLAIAGIGTGLKIGGALFGGARRRRRRKQLEAQLERAAGIRTEAIDKTRRAAVSGQLATRERAEEAGEERLEQLELQARRRSGGAQAGLDPATLESVIRAGAASSTQIDADIADQITAASQRAELARADVLAGLEEQKAALRKESGEQADAAIGGVLESAGGALGLLTGGGGGSAGAAGAAGVGTTLASTNIGETARRRRRLQEETRRSGLATFRGF